MLIILNLPLHSSLVTGSSTASSNQSDPVMNPTKKDSVPESVSDEWLNSLRDENGNRIMPEDPEGDAIQRKVFNSMSASSEFGCSVSSAGDVNGDGYDDIIVGAYAYNSSTGRAYIYYGGIIMNTTPDVIMTGEATSNAFGNCVSSAGDVNGDGYADVIVGARWYNASAGKVYIFFGGTNMNNIADLTMTGEFIPNNFGVSVSSAGDVNGDGYADVIVGANEYASNTGKAYIYFGGENMNSTADVTMTGSAPGYYFGGSVSSAGDVNGDGYADVIAGAVGYNSTTGRAYIFYGGAVMNSTEDVTLTGEATSSAFGGSVSSAQDVNGDGYADVIIGAKSYNVSTGRAYIFLGGASMDNTADLIMTGETTTNHFGSSVSSSEDMNGDGYSDVIIGAYSVSSLRGRIYIYFGGGLMNNTADVVITGEATSNYFGYSVSSAGDVNGDGYSEVIVGANRYNSYTGRAYMYDYALKGVLFPDQTFTGAGTNAYTGNSVSSAGDVNGDGYSDIIVGSYGINSGAGSAYLFFGGVAMDNIADLTMDGELANNNFGYSVSTAGDVNGDGFGDVIVGAIGHNSSTGKVYIYFGGTAMDNTADITILGGATSDQFGRSVSTAGDVNSDGFSDVIIGAQAYSTYTGRAYIYYGGESMNTTVDVTITGETTNNYFGNSVKTAGDVNGDGYSDVIVGAYGNNSNTGKAYIYFGGSPMNNSADVSITGETTSAYFGLSVSTTGDINGDGYSDVVIGSPNIFSLTGRIYVYFGGAPMNNTADLTITGESATINYGYSVSGAGDLNGDGYSDMIAGAYFFGGSTGKTYIYLGSTSPDSIPDAIMNGETSSSNFGQSVSNAGDVNGDGYSDLVVGALLYSSGIGKAYFFYGSAISSKPIFLYVRDVPNDQGGVVNLKWARSGLDVIGNNTITDYNVEFSYPPSGGNFAWASSAVIPATKNSFYSINLNTPFDSSGSNTGTFFYRVTSRTSNPSVFWRSAILSGRSLDNIAPLMVSPFMASSAGMNVILNWGRSESEDLMNYIIYRSYLSSIDPETEPVFATTTDSTYQDTSPLSGVYYYYIVAQDIHNNKSPVALAESPNMTLDLTLFIEGMYNPSSNLQVSDTLLVELRYTATPFNAAETVETILTDNGTAQAKFSSAPDGSYFIAVKHRNALDTWSSLPVSLSRSAPTTYSFSSSASQAYGNNMIQVDTSPLRFALYSGDVNQDETVDATDVSMIDNDAQNFVSGYVVTDLTGDDFVDGTDFALADNNAANYVSVIRP